MATVDAFEAQDRLNQLLDRVAQGQEITITRNGIPVARLIPADFQARRTDIHLTIAEGHSRARFEQAMAKVSDAEPAPHVRLPDDRTGSASSTRQRKSPG